ncbi:sigma-54-dependent transcriptional regulator [Flectobacillus major]|uniref:sigma-54-dependent transcriptional regulator n=1 Tax=Flectobacillus major TaxID=103 RepID=UPI00041EEE5F|nr:sigma-54 dependent transcriptional regulator [Flectobacillus major]
MIKKDKILIVEDEFIVAYDLKIMLTKAGYLVAGIATSVERARQLIEQKKPDWVLLDIILKGDETGIDLARELLQKRIPFLFISANTDQTTLEAAKATQPYGFLVKPFRERDLFVMLDIARYRYGVEMGTIYDTPSENQKTVVEIEGIIGNSKVLLDSLEKIKIVAPTNTSVIILGESGTGKERVAQAIHQQSARKNQSLVTINCAALPFNLIESELFGHEKGAFTGANQKRIGKFEQAHGGTIFLDEIGELPLDAQVKLLRVLQEKEIERIGSDATIKVDVRIIAATNRNLEQEVSEGRFRLDLYYRLNVFPIALPALRERKEDIPLLTHYFLKKINACTGRKITRISDSAMQKLQAYDWPGNIRELEHLIERSVLLAQNQEIVDIHLPNTPKFQAKRLPAEEVIDTMDDMEREHILKALRNCQGKVSGIGGAAEALGMSPQTLYARIKKLGIKMGYT